MLAERAECGLKIVVSTPAADMTFLTNEQPWKIQPQRMASQRLIKAVF